MKKKINKKNQITELIILFSLLIISFFLWNTNFVYPIKLFVVMLHELGHALAAILSGGKVTAINISFDLSGKCEIEGGNNILIASAGYLGSLFLGLLFFLSPNNKKIGKRIIVSTAVILLITTMSIATESSFILLAFILFVLLIAAAFYLRIAIVSILMRAFGLISCVYVLFDIKEDIFFKSNSVSDATILSNLINIPVMLIGTIWIVISAAGIFLALKLSYK
ncbi:MAG: M50 family metallopeptidase [Bacteroidota bacterium]